MSGPVAPPRLPCALSHAIPRRHRPPRPVTTVTHPSSPKIHPILHSIKSTDLHISRNPPPIAPAHTTSHSITRQSHLARHLRNPGKSRQENSPGNPILTHIYPSRPPHASYRPGPFLSQCHIPALRHPRQPVSTPARPGPGSPTSCGRIGILTQIQHFE